jgi:DNA-binding IclR family transcriptional regulator
VAAPVKTSPSVIAAAVNVSAAAQRVSLEDFRDRFLPALRETAAAISVAASHAPRGFWLGVEGR